jgi:enamine deaminase RidA (YjgF/YER057c/UK114 family)
MELRPVNPTPWLGGFNIHHGVEVSGASRTLYLSGQTSNAADGAVVHPGDLVAQFKFAWGNLKDALAEANMTAENVVRLNFFTTDVDAFMGAAGELVPIYAADGCKPAGTLVGVTRLFHPDIMVEIEAVAVA